MEIEIENENQKDQFYMVKQFIQDGNKNKKREMKNYKLLIENGVSQEFVKIYEQNLDET